MTRSLINEARKIIQGKTLTEAVSKFEIQFDEVSFFKGNDLMKAMNQTKKDGNSQKALDDLTMLNGGDDVTLTFTASNPSEAVRNAEKAILDYRNKQVNRDRNALFVFNGLELQLVTKFKDKGKSSDGDGTLPTNYDKNIFKNVFRKYNSQPMFNTSNGKGPSDLQKFVKDEGLDDMVIDGVM